MAVGDWPSGAHITVRRGYLNFLSDGAAHIVDVDFDVVLPSGATVFNAGIASFVPYHFSADSTQSIASQSLASMAGLAAREGLNVHLTTGIVHPDGSFTPA